MTSAVQHLSIAFTTAELAALAADLGVDPARLGGPGSVPDPRQPKERVVAEGRATLRARGVIRDTEQGVAVAEAVAAIVDVVGTAPVRVDVRTSSWTRFLTQGEASVRMRDGDGLVSFTPFATADLLAWIAAAAGWSDRPAGGDAAIELTGPGYLRLRQQVRAGDRAGAGTTLAQEAVAVPEPVLAALADPGRAGALTVHRRLGRLVVGGELAWLDAGAAGFWILPTVDLAGPVPDPPPGSGSGRPAGGEHDDAGAEPVRLAPVAARTLVETAAGFLHDPR